MLIVDDNAMNRLVLSEMLGDDYRIAEVCDGDEAIDFLHERSNEISLMLLDIMMPRVSGLEVLEYMKANKLIDTIPVIVVSAESENEVVSKAFDLGATDYLNRNFDERIVKRRVENAIMLYAKQKRLVGMVASQIYERERSNDLMVSILSHTVEFRNQESGMHVQNVRRLTELILNNLAETHPELSIDADYISIVSMASALHDIGKIAIPEEILNKPGRLTDEEFAIMKTHSLEGAKMLEKIPSIQSEPLVKSAYEIARWHHERDDGRGYPDGLSGDDIPLSAQVVSLADVYDALTSERAYKSAFSHEKACEMILNGECGNFNPMLMESLRNLGTRLSEVVDVDTDEFVQFDSVDRIANEISAESDLTPVSKTIEMLEKEKEKYSFFSSLTEEFHFEYIVNPSMLILPENTASYFGIGRRTFNPLQNEKVIEVFGGQESLDDLISKIKSEDSKDAVIDLSFDLYKDGEPKHVRAVIKTYYNEETGQLESLIGRLFGLVDNEHSPFDFRMPSGLDPLTGLYDAESFRTAAEQLLSQNDLPYAMIIIDMDDFGKVNEKHGHLVGNSLLRDTADRIRYMVRNEDLIARIGGDEFLVLAQFDKGEESVFERLQENLSGPDEDGLGAKVSLGVAFTEDVGSDYDELFNASDKALRSAKEAGKNQCVIYENSMSDKKGNKLSTIIGSQLIYGWRKTDLRVDEQV